MDIEIFIFSGSYLGDCGVGYMLNLGNGEFSEPYYDESDGQTLDLDSGDLNDDQREDVLFSSDGNLYAWLNLESGIEKGYSL